MPDTSKPLPQPDHSASSRWKAPPSSQAVLPALASLFALLCAFLCVFYFSHTATLNARTYRPSPASPFNLTNALRHVRHLGQSKRFVSSASLEASLQYIHAQLQPLARAAAENKLRLDVHIFRSQPASFCTSISIYTLRHSYDNLTSVVARLRPAHLPIDTEEPPLLINAHVDSAVGAPGVSDNLSGVGLVLEIIRILATSAAPIHNLQRPVVFLFNGAEEIVLNGAHSFISQHPWGRRPAAHINLESIGSGNMYYLFQLGPNAPWLAKVYARAVSVPFTSVSGSDVYNTKIIPAETDYRIFNEFAGIPGFDLALHDHGYIYHTIYDDYDRLNHQGVLHGGVTVYELTLELAGKADAIGVHLAGRDSGSRIDHIARKFVSTLPIVNPRDDFVFFDLFHRLTVVYSAHTALLLNAIVVLSTVAIWLSKMVQWTLKGRLACLRMLFTMLASVVAAFASTTFASYVYTDLLNLKLVWYGSTSRALLLFVPPMMCGVLSALYLTLPRRLMVDRFEHMLFAISMLYLGVALFLMRVGVMSAYIPVWLLMVMNVVALQGRRVSEFVRHSHVVMMHVVLTTFLGRSVLSTMLPLLGRSRVTMLSHDAIGAIIVTFCGVIYVVFPCLPILTHYAAALRRLVRMSAVCCLFVAMCFVMLDRRVVTLKNWVGYPYSEKAPKRMSVMHVFSPNMTPNALIILASQDARPLQVGRMAAPLFEADKDVGTMSGLPRVGSLEQWPVETLRQLGMAMQDMTVLRSGNRPALPMPTIEAVQVARLEDGERWNVSYVMAAEESHSMAMRVMHGEGSLIVDWSFSARLKQAHPFSRWVRHHGSERLRFWVVLRDGQSETQQEQGMRPLVTFMLSSSRFGSSRSPDDLAKLNFERWESPSLAVSVATEVTA